MSSFGGLSVLVTPAPPSSSLPLHRHRLTEPCEIWIWICGLSSRGAMNPPGCIHGWEECFFSAFFKLHIKLYLFKSESKTNKQREVDCLAVSLLPLET